MSDEELEQQIIQQIEVLVEELGGSMCQSTRCNSMGRRSKVIEIEYNVCLLYTSPSPRDRQKSRMPSSA